MFVPKELLELQPTAPIPDEMWGTTSAGTLLRASVAAFYMSGIKRANAVPVAEKLISRVVEELSKEETARDIKVGE